MSATPRRPFPKRRSLRIGVGYYVSDYLPDTVPMALNAHHGHGGLTYIGVADRVRVAARFPTFRCHGCGDTVFVAVPS